MVGTKTLSAAALLALLCGALALSARSAPNTAATVNVGQTRVGEILVDGSGRSLYYYVTETKNQIGCRSDILTCTKIWPPLMTTGKPHAGPGVKASLLGTVHRIKPSGVQVTYNGHPLYTYSGDSQPGDLNGQAFYSLWYVLSPSGKPIKTK